MILNVYVCFRYCDLLFVDKLGSMYHKVHGNKEVFCWAALACLLRVPGDIGCTIGVLHLCMWVQVRKPFFGVYSG